MTRKLPKNVYSERSRHGRRVYYFRMGKGARVRLPDILNADDFREAVRVARESNISVPLPRVERSSFDMRRKQRAGLTIEAAVKAARSRAAERRIPFSLDIDWALKQAQSQDFKCCLTGIPFYMDSDAISHVHPFTPSLDRINPKAGYVPANVRLVVYAMNVMLHDWGVEVFERVVSGYRHTKGTKTRTLFPHLLRAVRAGAGIQK